MDRGHKIILVYPIPAVGWDVPRKIFTESRNINSNLIENLDSNPITSSFQVYLNRHKPIFEMFDSIKHQNVYHVYPHELFCDSTIQNRCTTHDLEYVFYKNDDHLSLRGSEMLMQILATKINQLK